VRPSECFQNFIYDTSSAHKGAATLN